MSAKERPGGEPSGAQEARSYVIKEVGVPSAADQVANLYQIDQPAGRPPAQRAARPGTVDPMMRQPGTPQEMLERHRRGVTRRAR
jgi:hypothetical protein